ncbi:MAG: Cof-type HAD-IIB family hydrolase [Oscillospiraceae bacterium]|nr:Cof-type HAD-IIB family hydrolase [Oscillospiraceae bacterium]
MEVKAIVTDLDDTLLKCDKSVSNYTKLILEKCVSKGIKLIYATARGPSAEELIPTELFEGSITMNGAVACVLGNVIYEKYIEPEIFSPFLIKMNEYGIKSAAEIDGVHHANFEVNSMWTRKYVISDFRNIEGKTEKLYMIVESEGDCEFIKQNLPSGLYVHFTKDSLALVMNREATKLKALSAVLEYFELDFSQVVAFGDDINDIEILRKCGIGVAMENALEDVKETADEGCGDCDSDGVAHWLEKNILQEKIYGKKS